MKKIIMIMTVLILVLVQGCSDGRNSDDDRDDDDEETVVNEEIAEALGIFGKDGNGNQGEGDIILDIDNTNVDVDALDWPSELSDIPEYSYGDISAIHKEEDSYEGIDFVHYNIMLVNVEEGSAHQYAEELDDIGLHKDFGPNEIEISVTGAISIEYNYSLYLFDTEERVLNMGVDFWSDDKGSGAVFISIPLKPDGAYVDEEHMEASNGNHDVEGQNDNQGDGQSTIIEVEGGTIEMVEDGLPENFPIDIVPLYDGHLIVEGGQETNAEGMIHFTVFCVSNDDPELVAERAGDLIIEAADEVYLDMTSEGIRVVTAEIDGWNVQFYGGEDGSNYPTSFGYSVSKEE